MSTPSHANGDPSVHPVARGSTTSTPPVRKPSPLSLIRTLQLPKTLSLLVLLSLSVFLTPVLFASGASADACPNAAFRQGPSTNLPDCRAYELVTPPYKASSPDAFRGALVSSDGEQLVIGNYGVFAGASHDTESLGEPYLLSRSPTAWNAAAAGVPSSQVGGAEFSSEAVVTTLEATGEASLWNLPRSASPRLPSVLERRAGLGAFVEIGPRRYGVGTRFASFDGASRDLNTVLLNAGSELEQAGFESTTWPGDTTAHENLSSLYQYVGPNAGLDGVEREPELVGVLNEGHLHGTPHINEGAQLISECGTVLGDPTGSEQYNSVANEGNVVFFTALHRNGCTAPRQPSVGELWARVGRERSVAISEPALLPGACAAGEPCSGAEPAEGVFRGASSDGTRVFFTSEQPLVNGAPAEGLKLYEARLEGPKVAELVDVSGSQASEPPMVQGVARVSEDGQRVYFVARGALASGAKPGGDNLYAYDTLTSHTSFVATLSESDEADWSTEDERPVQVTPDGAHLVFDSAAVALTGNASGNPQVFEYDANTSTLELVSRPQTGFAGAGIEDTSRIPAPNFAKSPTNPTQGLALSDTGTGVAFSSEAQLTPYALNGHNNVYAASEGNAYLISNGQDTSPPNEVNRRGGAELIGIDPTGSNIYFSTVSKLAPQQQDSQRNIYDARVEGGFAEPSESLGCSGDGCQAERPEMPPQPTPVTASTRPGDNLPTSRAIGTAKPKTMTRRQKLTRALKLCRRLKHKRSRRICETKAHKGYGTTASAKHKNGS